MNTKDTSILKSTGIMTVATLLSRLTGLVRTWAMAFALGNTLITSAYQVANNMPNVIFDLVAGGILGTAFLPVYLLEREKQGAKGSDAFASNILNIFLVGLGAISLLATIFAPQVISTQTFTVSSDAEVFEYAVLFFRVFAIQILFYGLGGVITGILNANRIYGVPALAPAVNNIVTIISFFAYVPLSHTNPQLALIVLAVGTTLGVFAQFVVQIPTLLKMGFTYVARIDLHDPALKEALRIALPTLIYVAGTLVSFSCRNAFSLQTGDEGPATLLYAWTWYQLPYGVVAVSLSTAFLTEMSAAVARKDLASLRIYVEKGLRSTLFIIIPLAGLMFSLAGPIIQIFRAGAFDQEAVQLVSTILALWVISLPFYAGQMYFYRVFASLRQFMTFATITCVLCVVQILLYKVLTPANVLGLAGIPIADLIYFVLQFFITSFILKKRIGSFGFKGLLVMCVKVSIATAAGMIVASSILPFIPLPESTLGGLVKITICGIAGLLVIFFITKLLHIPEMEVAVSSFSRLLNKFKKSDAAN